MIKISYTAIYIFLCFCIAGFGEAPLKADGITGHLDLYSQVNKTSHDNIDDSVSEHAHCHKHSEDGEEHEHNHEHTQFSQFEIKILGGSLDLIFRANIISSTSRAIVKSLNSNPHLLKIFRPPIT